MIAEAGRAWLASFPMYQVNFSDQAMRALGKLPTLEQMEVVEAFSSLTPEDLLAGRSGLRLEDVFLELVGEGHRVDQ